MSIVYRDSRGLVARVTAAADGADVVVVHPYEHAVSALCAGTPCYGRPLGHWLHAAAPGPQR